MFKRLLSLLAVAVVLAACGGGTTEATLPPVAAPDDVPESAQVYTITNGEARFFIDEVLRGDDFQVVGTNDQINGSITFDPANPAATASIGTIAVNATTFITDSNLRNRAINEFILETSTEGHETITFEATEIDGLPESIEFGTSYPVTITGDLTVHNATNPVTFAAEVTPLSETVIEALASATIAYADWGVTIPSVPQVSFVADELLMEFEFTAEAQ